MIIFRNNTIILTKLLKENKISKRSLRKIRHTNPSPSFKELSKAGIDGTINTLWQKYKFSNEVELTANQMDMLNNKVQELIDKTEELGHEHNENCNH